MRRDGGVIVELILYLLITFGAIIMLMPFAWMVDTSFKLPGEVESWPPRWTSENFKKERILRVFIHRGGSTEHFEGLSLSEFMNIAFLKVKERKALNLRIFDDPPRRGTLEIRIGREKADYARDIPKEEFEELIEKLESLDPIPSSLEKLLRKIRSKDELDEIDMENFVEDLLNIMYYDDSALLNRRNFTENFGRDLKKSLSFLEKYGPRLVKKIEDGKIKEKFENLLGELNGDIFLMEQSLSDYKKGISKNLKDVEVRDILRKVKELVSNDPRKLEEEDGDHSKIFNLVHRRVILPVERWHNLLIFHNDLKEFLSKVQTVELKDNIIVARIREKNSKEVVDEFRQKVMESKLDRETKDAILRIANEDFEDLVNLFIRWMDEKVVKLIIGKLKVDLKKAINISEQLNGVLSLFEEIASDREELKVDMERYLGEGNLSSAFRVIENVSNSSVKILKGKIEKLQKIVGNPEILSEIISTRWKLLEYLRNVVVIYNDVTTKLEMMRSPKIVKTVRLKAGNIISVEFEEGVNPIWFEDEEYNVKVRFTFTDLLKNIFQNYVDAWKAAPFARYYINTVFVALTTTVMEVIFAAMAAFAFAKLNFFGKNAIFIAFLSTMMVPMEVLLVPNYITLAKFGWLDTYYALIVPWTVSVFAIFLMRQHFMSLPNELYDAAKIDGSSDWRFLWSIMVPLSKPVIITAALLKFVGSWNAFLWVLIVTKSPEVRTLPVGLQNFSSEVGTLYNQLMAASTFSILPVIILFLFAQKYFIRGIARTGLK